MCATTVINEFYPSLMMLLTKSGSSIGARPLQLPDASSSEVQHHLDTCMQLVYKQLATQTDVDRKHLA